MKKILLTFLFTLYFSANTYGEIIFRVICESPKGKGISTHTSNNDNKTRFDGFKDDGYPDDDLIELIYDSSSPNQIQRIWGKDNNSIKLNSYNKNFYHWRMFKPNFANGFHWGDWSFSLPDLILIWTKGATYKDSLGSGIHSTTMYSRCKRIN